MSAQIAIIMGSDSDLEVMKEAAVILDKFKIEYELTIVSAHRTPERMVWYAREAATRGIRVIIAGAGGSAHLPGMVASLTHLPVIGVPVLSKTMNGVDSLYSIVQMPPGVPVATVAINGAANAALLALQVLALENTELTKELIDYKEDLKNQVEDKAEKLEQSGWKKYLRT